jgi:hypothetical protein
MSVAYIPLESKSGFKSPGFLVDENGNLTITGALAIGSDFSTSGIFRINGIELLDATDSTVALGSQIKRSSLTQLGSLEFLNIDGDLVVTQGSTPYIQIINGNTSINSVNGVGAINNIDIGLAIPADGNFKSVNVGPGDSQGELSVQGSLIVTGTTTLTGTMAISGDIELGLPPTSSTHATRKDYVDAKIAAFAIAFGA